MHKEKDLIRLGPDQNGYIRYAVPNHNPMQDWNDYTIIPNEEVEFENGCSPSLKNGEIIKLHGMIIGNSCRLAGMFERQTEEEFMAEILAETETFPKIESKTDPLEDWLN